MRFSSVFLLQFLNILLTGAVAYTMGVLVAEWMHREILTFPIHSLISENFQPVTTSSQGGRLQEEFQVILDRNVFKAQKTEIPLLLPEPIPEPETELIVEKSKEKIKRTRLQIVLTGTMLYGEDNPFAFISPQARINDYTIYQVGECFNPKTVKRDKVCKKDSVMILKIGDRRVVIVHQGNKQALWMVESKGFEIEIPRKINQTSLKSTALIVPSVEKNSPQQKPVVYSSIKKVLGSREPEVAKEGQTSFNFERIWVDEQLENFDQLLMDARVVPTKKGDLTLFMFQFIKEASIYRKLGLKAKDIILAVNGYNVDSVPKALKLLEALQSEREINLKIEREGEPIEFNYFID